jgi:SAM-dependent methyltransferase
MITTTPEREPVAHLLIGGTGRTGTSFLVRWLTELGMDTHLSRYGEEDAWDGNANAGLETVPVTSGGRKLPYVIKFPWLYQCIDQILAGSSMRIDSVIIPTRDLMEAATSRTVVELRAMHEALPWIDEMDQSWEIWGRTPGGIAYSLNPLDQGRILAVGFHYLVERLVRADIPIVFLAFPRLVEDWRYLFDKLRPFLPSTASEDSAALAHRRLSDLAKVRVGAELDGATRPNRIIKYPPHNELDAIAIRRELARTHKALSDAKAAEAQARTDAGAASAARDAALAEANAWREALTRATMSAATAAQEAQAAAAAAVTANEEAVRANQDAYTLREALAGAEYQLAELSAAQEAQVAAAVTANEEAVRANQDAHTLREALAGAEYQLAELSAAQEAQVAAAVTANEEAARSNQEAVRASQDAHALREALAGAEYQLAELSAAQSRAATLQYEIGEILASRSWRLTSGYRALGRAIQNLRGGIPRLTSVQTGLNASADTHTDPSVNWPVWTGENSFRTNRFGFVMSLDKDESRTEHETVVLLKDRTFVEIYRNITNELRPQRILEIGFFQGGMPLLLADTLAPEKVVGLDYLQPSDALTSMIAGAGLQDTIKLYGGILQDDLPTLRRIVEGEFADRPLDLIIDDASHEYENSRGCFQELFGYLRPGGKYVIEDWGWLHWPGEKWQTAKSHFWGQPATTNLVFEVIMTLGSTHPKIIAKIEILSWACMVVTRGDGLGYRERVDLAETRLTSGRTFHPL